jgi:hypothetical protein
VLRREGTISAQEVKYAHGVVVFDRIEEAGTPWNPARTAPKDGGSFIAYDSAIKSAETARWSAEKSKFINFIGDKEVPFTQWMEQPD